MVYSKMVMFSLIGFTYWWLYTIVFIFHSWWTKYLRLNVIRIINVYGQWMRSESELIVGGWFLLPCISYAHGDKWLHRQKKNMYSFGCLRVYAPCCLISCSRFVQALGKLSLHKAWVNDFFVLWEEHKSGFITIVKFIFIKAVSLDFWGSAFRALQMLFLNAYNSCVLMKPNDRPLCVYGSHFIFPKPRLQ